MRANPVNLVLQMTLRKLFKSSNSPFQLMTKSQLILMIFMSMGFLRTIIILVCMNKRFGNSLILSSYLGINHSVVVYPENTDDVVKIVKIANKYRMPIVPYAGATSLEGQYRGVWHCYTFSYLLDANSSASSILLGVFA